MNVKPEVRHCPVCQKSFMVGGRGNPTRKQQCCSRVCAVSQRWKDPYPIINETVKASEHPSVLDIAWAAGFYEGEGNVFKNNSVGVGIAQVKPWALQRLVTLFGGRISNENTYKSGRYKGRERARVWTVTGPRARGFLMTIYKFLSPRRQARIKEVLSLA